MKTKHKDLKAVDAEYAEALAAFRVARKRLRAAAQAREQAHVAVEFAASRQGQKFANMSDEEWAKLKQRVDASRGPKVEPVVSAPSAE